MSAAHWPGMPLQLQPTVAVVIAQAGEVEEGDGWQMLLMRDRLVIRVAVEGEEVEASATIEEIIEAICKYTKEQGS